MNRLFIIFASLLFGSSVFAMTCPTPSASGVTKQDLYDYMIPGTGNIKDPIYTNSVIRRPIVFVDQRDLGNKSLLAQYGEINNRLFQETGLGSFSSRNATQGTFKVAYGAQAPECRRQILIGNEIGNSGRWNGWTAVELCKPSLVSLFRAAKAKTIDGVLRFAKTQLPRAQYNELYDTLFMHDFQKPLVKYFKDASGNLLPRFAVQITSLHYEQNHLGCRVVIDHADDAMAYGGLGTGSAGRDFDFLFSFEPEPSNRELLYFNGNRSSTYIFGQ